MCVKIMERKVSNATFPVNLGCKNVALFGILFSLFSTS